MKRTIQRVLLASLTAGLLSAGFIPQASANMPVSGSAKAVGSSTSKALLSRAGAATIRARAFRIAMAQRGDMYRYGAAGPDRFDCSGLTFFSYKRAGKAIPRTSSAQRRATYSISLSRAVPGDLIFYSGHVEMFAGKHGGRYYAVAANTTGRPVNLHQLRQRGLVKVGRVRI